MEWVRGKNGIRHPTNYVPAAGTVVFEKSPAKIADMLEVFSAELNKITLSANVENYKHDALMALNVVRHWDAKRLEMPKGDAAYCRAAIDDLVEVLNEYGPADLVFGKSEEDPTKWGWWWRE